MLTCIAEDYYANDYPDEESENEDDAFRSYTNHRRGSASEEYDLEYFEEDGDEGGAFSGDEDVDALPRVGEPWKRHWKD